MAEEGWTVADVFFVKREGELLVGVDSHTTGLFRITAWECLSTDNDFKVERGDYPVSKDGRPMFL